MIEPTSTYWEAFKVLYQDFEDSFRYVNPGPEHFTVYSLRYYELLLRACTEFESLCKLKLIELRLSNKHADDFNITDYFLLAKPLEITGYAVGYHFDPIQFREPLQNWKNSHRLGWYQDYNIVKHNRATEFKKANFQNVLDAIGALFLMITKCELSPKGTYSYLQEGDSTEFPGMVFTIDGWPLLMRKSIKNNERLVKVLD